MFVYTLQTDMYIQRSFVALANRAERRSGGGVIVCGGWVDVDGCSDGTGGPGVVRVAGGGVAS